LLEEGAVVVVQGAHVTDRAVIDSTNPDAGEAVVMIRRELFLEAARNLEGV